MKHRTEVLNGKVYTWYQAILEQDHEPKADWEGYPGVKRTGKVGVELGKFFTRMYDFRQKGEYADFVQYEEEKMKEWLVSAEHFINELDKAIEIFISA